jgi:hypothetical protein
MANHPGRLQRGQEEEATEWSQLGKENRDYAMLRLLSLRAEVGGPLAEAPEPLGPPATRSINTSGFRCLQFSSQLLHLLCTPYLFLVARSLHLPLYSPLAVPPVITFVLPATVILQSSNLQLSSRQPDRHPPASLGQLLLILWTGKSRSTSFGTSTLNAWISQTAALRLVSA